MNQKLKLTLMLCVIAGFIPGLTMAQNEVCHWGAPEWSWAADFNADGKADVASANGTNVYMHLSTGREFSNQAWKVPGHWGNPAYTWVADFTGDGKADIATSSGADVHMYLSNSYAFNYQKWTVPPVWSGPDYTWAADFNGDGKADIASAHGDKVHMHLSTGSSFDNQVWPVPATWGASGYTWVADFNGDGKADIASALGGNVHMNLSTGTSFTSQTWTVPDAWGVSGLTFVGDFNGDGKADITSAGGWNRQPVYVHTSTGDSFNSQTHLLPATDWSNPDDWWTPDSETEGKPINWEWWSGDNYNFVADFNGDRNDDIISISMTITAVLGQAPAFLHLFSDAKPNPKRTAAQNWRYERTGSGDWEKKMDTGFIPWGHRGKTWLADFNGDGLKDIATAVSMANNCLVYMHLSPQPNKDVRDIGHFNGFDDSLWTLYPDNFDTDQ